MAKEAAHLITVVAGRAEAVKIALRPLNLFDHLNLSQTSCLDAQVFCHFLQFFYGHFLLPQFNYLGCLRLGQSKTLRVSDLLSHPLRLILNCNV